MLNNVEFSELKLSIIRAASDPKKIKFKQESYSNIKSKYNNFRISTQTANEIAKQSEETTKIPDNMPDKVIIHIKNKKYEQRESKQEKLKDKVYMLKVEGTLLPQLVSRRALKIKSAMEENMRTNNGKACKDEPVTSPVIPEEVAKVQEQLVLEGEEPKTEIKVSKNGASNAKIEKYFGTLPFIEVPTRIEVIPKKEITEKVIDKFKITNTDSIEQQDEKTVSPVAIEESIAMPISNDSDEYTPVEKAQAEVSESKLETEHLKDYLARAAKLRKELAEAQEQAEIAKKNAEQAREKAAAEKKEAEAVQEQLVETMKKLEKHNQELEEQKKAREAEAKRYSEQSQEYLEKGKEYSSMQEEYKNTINEMLAAMN